MNKRGVALILSFTVVVVLTILSAGIIVRSIAENNINKRFIAQTKAFWTAEAGIAAAVSQLPATGPLNNILDGANNLIYSTTTAPVAGFSNRWDITSTGSYVLRRDSEGAVLETIDRTIAVVAEKSSGSNPDLLTNAIETTGDLDIKGSVDINPPDSTETASGLNFESVFGMTKDELKVLADHIYINPSTNQQPVEGITWVDLTGTNKYVISSDWSGSGVLIVNGNGTDIALDIAGAWDFRGVIWVIGRLSISGRPIINGVVFAESSIDVTQTLTGNVTLNFSAEDRDSVFNLITQKIGINILSWREVYN